MHRNGADCPLIEHGDPYTERSPLLAEVYADGGNLPTRANARLIAASPDLLAALKEIGEDKIRQGDAIWMRDIARAAIEKAEAAQ
jgi:hypothetical protein